MHDPLINRSLLLAGINRSLLFAGLIALGAPLLVRLQHH